MAMVKKAILSLFLIFLILLELTQVIFGASTGKATKEAKLKKSMDNSSITLEIIPKNDEFEILEEHEDWYRVNYQRIKGYVRKEQVEVIKQESNNKGNSVQSNSTNEEKSQNTIEEQTGNETSENTNTVTQEQTSTQEEEMRIGMTVYAKNQLQISVRPVVSSMKVLDIQANEPLTIIDMANKWVYVSTNHKMGWIRKDLLTTIKKKTEVTTRSSVTRTTTQQVQEQQMTTNTKTKTQESTTTNTIKNAETQATATTNVTNASKIVEMAKTYLGSRYVYGGSSPSGFDCSGFIMYLYKQFGVSLPHSATAQSKKGTKVEKANLQPGDIVFFSDYKTNKGIGHCGLYIGNNQFIHASTEKTGVITSSLNKGSYQTRYVTAVRIF